MTTNSCILDASVILKLVCQEEDSGLAITLFNFLSANKINAYEPTFVKIEVISVLRKKASFGKLKDTDLRNCVNRFKSMDVDYVNEDWRLLERSLTYSDDIKSRVIYDCVYLALAFQMRCNLITADEKFVNIVSPKFQNVFLLQDWETALKYDGGRS